MLDASADLDYIPSVPEPAPVLPELLTCEEVAALVRTTPRAIKVRVRRGTIPAACVVPELRPLRFYHAQVRAWLGLGDAVATVDTNTPITE